MTLFVCVKHIKPRRGSGASYIIRLETLWAETREKAEKQVPADAKLYVSNDLLVQLEEEHKPRVLDTRKERRGEK